MTCSAAGFGDGFNGPLLLAVDLDTATEPHRGPRRHHHSGG